VLATYHWNFPHTREENILAIYDKIFTQKMRQKLFSQKRGKTSQIYKEKIPWQKKFPLFTYISVGGPLFRASPHICTGACWLCARDHSFESVAKEYVDSVKSQSPYMQGSIMAPLQGTTLHSQSSNIDRSKRPGGVSFHICLGACWLPAGDHCAESVFMYASDHVDSA
jgi:hypothetical protein